MSFEIRSLRQWAVVCTDCGCAVYGRWRPTERQTECDLEYAAKYGCRICRDKATVAALPEHHPHKDRHPSNRGHWPCCGAVQIGIVSPNECNACGEPYPCSTIRAVVG